MLHGLGIERSAPPITAFRASAACLLVAEQATAWAQFAEEWRAHGVEVSVLIRESTEHEPAFVRRLYALIARAELASRPFASAVLLANAATGAQVEAARTRLASSLAHAILSGGGSVALYLDGGEPALLERRLRSLEYELRDPALTLRIGTGIQREKR